MKKTKGIQILLAVAILVVGCEKESPENNEEPIIEHELASISINSAHQITSKGATFIANISNDGGANVTSRGFVYNTTGNPSLDNYEGKTSNGQGKGEYKDSTNNMKTQTKYFLKAFATNSVGTAYSGAIDFTTLEQLFADGNGTKNDPYLIKTAQQLDSVRYFSGKHFKQIADIDLSNFSSEDWIPVGKWLPIGDIQNPFIGSYNGNDLKIINLTVDLIETENVGLFGFCSSSFLQNVTLENINIRGKNNVGGLVGNYSGEIINSNVNGIVTGENSIGGLIGQYNSGEISNCKTNVKVTGGSKSYFVGGLIGFNEQGIILDNYSIGDVSGNANVSGLIGLNKGQINDCSAQGDIIGNWNVGGLVGGNTGIINGCKAEGNIIGETIGITCVGGLVGINTIGEITNSNASGDVTGDEFIGGLIGKNKGEVKRSFAIGKIKGRICIGGLIGWNENGNLSQCYAFGETKSEGDCAGGLVGKHTGNIIESSLEGNGDIFESYATGNVNGNNNIGGLVGLNDEGNIKNNYAKGKISGSANIGGLIGKNNGQIINGYSIGLITGNEDTVGGLVGNESSGGRITTNFCYYDKITSGQNDYSKGMPKTTEEMMQKYTFFSHWDFDNIWNIDDGKSYPFLKWE